MLDALGSQHVPLVQAWLNEDRAELGGAKTLEALSQGAHNSSRGARALASARTVIEGDAQGRITARRR